jgi:hypothetical protein
MFLMQGFYDNQLAQNSDWQNKVTNLLKVIVSYPVFLISNIASTYPKQRQKKNQIEFVFYLIRLVLK